MLWDNALFFTRDIHEGGKIWMKYLHFYKNKLQFREHGLLGCSVLLYKRLFPGYDAFSSYGVRK